MSDSRSKEVWKTLATVGISAAAIGLGAFGFDFVTRGRFPFISDNSEMFLLEIPSGVALLLVSLFACAAALRKTGRTRIAFFIFTVPIGVILLGYALGGASVHGPFFTFLLEMAPLIAIGLIGAIMTASIGMIRSKRQNGPAQ